MLFRRGRRATAAAPSPDGTETDERPISHDHDRELEAVTSLSGALARAHEPEAIARTLLEECVALLELDFAAVALISEDGEEATGLLALEGGGAAGWWRRSAARCAPSSTSRTSSAWPSRRRARPRACRAPSSGSASRVSRCRSGPSGTTRGSCRSGPLPSASPSRISPPASGGRAPP